jgi:hypothetical protein
MKAQAWRLKNHELAHSKGVAGEIATIAKQRSHASAVENIASAWETTPMPVIAKR